MVYSSSSLTDISFMSFDIWFPWKFSSSKLLFIINFVILSFFTYLIIWSILIATKLFCLNFMVFFFINNIMARTNINVFFIEWICIFKRRLSLKLIMKAWLLTAVGLTKILLVLIFWIYTMIFLILTRILFWWIMS